MKGQEKTEDKNGASDDENGASDGETGAADDENKGRAAKRWRKKGELKERNSSLKHLPSSYADVPP